MKSEATEARKFNRLLDGLLAVPHSAIQRKLKAEKKKKRATRKPASRASASA